MYEIKKQYQQNIVLRKSFEALAMRTFHLDFEDWYQHGFWKDDYIPYSIVINDKVIANVSVNVMNMSYEQKDIRLLQLGTIMCERAYRNQGYIRELMKEIEHDYQGKIDGFYLFANDEVVNFYPKFEYHMQKEYQYYVPVCHTKPRTITKIPMDSYALWMQLYNVIETSIPYSKFHMTSNMGLYMFYVTKFMQDCVFYHEALKVYVVAQIKDNTAYIHAIFSKESYNMSDIIESFGPIIKEVVFTFTPLHTDSYICREVREEDTTLFVKGEFFETFDQRKLMFPDISHA